MDTASPQGAAVLTALDKSGGAFTPEVRAGFLAWRKAQAVAELAKHKIVLPKALLAAVDADPMAASTIYGIRHGSPAQALFVLRSLELDLGADRMWKHKQTVLSAAVHYASGIDLAAAESNSFSLKQRGPLTVKIPAVPFTKADTHPKDRPLDMNDHIINFLEEEEVVQADGKKTIRPRDPILTAGKVVADLKLQKEFNDYMATKSPGFEPIDCGDNVINTYKGPIWRHAYCARLQRAGELFTKAYIAKGRLPEKNDPACSPSEWIAYQVSNAENPERKTDLSSDWPIQSYMVGSRVPLREAEFVWDEKAKGINPMRYIMYIGLIAQSNNYLITLSRLQPFDFTYNSYPGKRLWGGVCGSHTHTNCVAGSVLGKSMMACSSPGHSFPGGINRDAKGIYSFSGGTTNAAYYFGVDKPEPVRSDFNKLYSLCWGMNFDPQAFVDADLAWTLEQSLPPQARAAHGDKLMISAAVLNPYHLGLVRKIQATLPTPQAQLGCYQEVLRALDAAASKPGCAAPAYRAELLKTLDQKLAAMPVPTDKAAVAKVAAYLESRGDATYAKYRIARDGLPAVQEALLSDLRSSVSGARTPASTELLAQRISSVGGLVPDPPNKTAWSGKLLELLKGKEFFTLQPDAKKPPVTTLDPCFGAAHALRAIGLGLPAAQAELEAELAAGIKSGRTKPVCDLLAARISAVGNCLPPPAAKQAAPKVVWSRKLLDLLKGNEVFAPDPAQSAQRISDPCLAAVYGLDDASQKVELQRLVKDYQSAVAANRGDETADALALRLQTLRATAKGAPLAAIDKGVAEALALHEFYWPDMNKTSVMKVDPALRVLQHKATKDVLLAGVKKALENGQSPETSAALSEYLRFLYTPIRWQIPQMQTIAREVIDTLRGHELYAPNPKNPGDVRFESLLSTVYHNWGITPHRTGGITTSEADLKACAETLKPLFAIRRTPEASVAMKQYVECLAGRLNPAQRKQFGTQLLEVARGHEYRGGEGGARVADECAVYIYKLAGQPIPKP